ncbi:5'-methylthioadenosine phosphorylase [Strigomonas culicis]|uniref:S-methyl-5'-thioadenosine phosphorylase n=1 Tax=Strigomonas culicis TaxID=28005 RepID=S9UXT6_9TRYP|nr:5'-methylthioadenosine phosphorylase [Strigomonas culicis]|eukprot:EPY33638.1 5'-methylthioadenosine phosphorylase [Strigomonas culicis]
MSTYSSPHPVPVRFAVIGGSGVYKLECLANAQSYHIDTPFGAPSDAIIVAELDGVPCAFLPRHGVGHRLNPSEVNYRANICALKQLGVEVILAINAVGSLDADYRPGDLAFVTQIIDRTVARPSTFFERGIVAHVDFAHPTSAIYTALALEATAAVLPPPGQTLHPSATAVTMEGPCFSTRAESLRNKAQGAHLIGMTTATEAKLAREAELAYVCVAMVTDMDAWSDAPHVDVSQVERTMKENAHKAQLYPPAIIAKWAQQINAADGSLREDPAFNALRYGILTSPACVTDDVRARMAPLLQKKYTRFYE